MHTEVKNANSPIPLKSLERANARAMKFRFVNFISIIIISDFSIFIRPISIRVNVLRRKYSKHHCLIVSNILTIGGPSSLRATRISVLAENVIRP